MRVLIKNQFSVQHEQLKNIFIETGSGNFFEPARKLFTSCGFEKCDPFGHYKDDPNSCYMKIKV